MILHWFRRDLRLADNTALCAAIEHSGGEVAPVYVQSEWRGPHRWTGAPRQDFLCGCLRSLAAELESVGGRLIVRRGGAVRELERLLRETGAEAVYYNRNPDPFGRAMESKVERMAKQLGVRAVGFNDLTVYPPNAVLTAAETPFRVFTPYAKAWLRLEAPKPDRRPVKFARNPYLEKLESLPTPTPADWGLFSNTAIIEPGEPAAKSRVEAFFSGSIYQYGELRDIPAAGNTSRFSADLRFGTLSIRELVHQCRLAASEAETAAQRKSVQTFLNELIWREFYMAILWHWPDVLDTEFQLQFRSLPWRWPDQHPTPRHDSAISPEKAFQRWCEGTTGFPIVDAGMRQLAATGFMHNRLRMIVAMFLTKDLHLDWRLGEQFFMQNLVDGDIAANNGGWQWSAGVGADAAPWFRIQNPWIQTSKFDPDGDYIRTWVPELRDVPAAALARPPLPGTRLIPSYPSPIVDHAKEREITLQMFRDR